MSDRVKSRLTLRRGLFLVVLGVIGGLLATGIGFLSLLIWDDAAPVQSQVCCTTPADWGFDFSDVLLASAGETLSGWYIPSRNGAVVILLHSGGIHRMGTAREASALAAEGFGILMYDRRAYGESTGDVNTAGWRDIEDIPAALAFLRQQSDVDPRRIGIFGASLGGQVALRAAAMHTDFRAVMADGPSLCGSRDHLPFWQLPLKYKGMQILERLARPLIELSRGMRQPAAVVDVIAQISPRPILLVATSGIEVQVVRRYFDFAGEPKTLWEIPEAGHGGGFAARPEEYRRRLVGFFTQTLLEFD